MHQYQGNHKIRLVSYGRHINPLVKLGRLKIHHDLYRDFKLSAAWIGISTTVEARETGLHRRYIIALSADQSPGWIW
jgi:hypothetical protein